MKKLLLLAVFKVALMWPSHISSMMFNCFVIEMGDVEEQKGCVTHLYHIEQCDWISER